MNEKVFRTTMVLCLALSMPLAAAAGDAAQGRE
jgi:hypothetical protein